MLDCTLERTPPPRGGRANRAARAKHRCRDQDTAVDARKSREPARAGAALKKKSFLARTLRAYFRLPEWLRPALAASAIVLAILVVRVLAELPALFTGRSNARELALTLAAAGAAGFVGGLVHGLTRPPLRKLGRAGDYLSGVALAHGYLGALLFASPFAFEHSAIPDDARGWWIWLGLITALGLVAGHVFFSGPEGLDRLKEQRRRPQVSALAAPDGRRAALVSGWIPAGRLAELLESVAGALGEHLPVGETARLARALQDLPDDADEGLEWEFRFAVPLVAHFVPDEGLLSVEFLVEGPDEFRVGALHAALVGRTVDPLAA